MTTTDREIETIAFYAGQVAALAGELRTTREDLRRATSDRDAYGQALHDLGAKVAGLQRQLLDAEQERDKARIRVGELLMAQEGTGAAPPAAVDPAQCVPVTEEAGAPTRTEPAGRSAPDLEAEHRESFPPAGELSDERIPFVPANGGEWKAGEPYTVGENVVPCVFPHTAAPPDPFLDGAPAPAREEPKHEPWWRYPVGPPKGAYHLFVSADSAEAECGETTDDETRPAPNLPPYEQTCMDCMDLAAQRGIKVPVCSDEAPAVATQPEPPEADDAEDPADEGAEPVRKKYARKPRTCVVPGCGRPGHSAVNEFGAKTSGGLWCDEHAKALTADERRDLHTRDKRARKEAAKAAKGVAA